MTAKLPGITPSNVDLVRSVASAALSEVGIDHEVGESVYPNPRSKAEVQLCYRAYQLGMQAGQAPAEKIKSYDAWLDTAPGNWRHMLEILP